MGWRSSLVGLAVLGGLGYLLYVSDSTGTEPDETGALTESVLGGRSVLDAARIVVRPDPEALWIEFAGIALAVVGVLREIMTKPEQVA